MKTILIKSKDYTIPESKIEIRDEGNYTALYINIEDAGSIKDSTNKQYSADYYLVKNPVTYNSIISAIIRDKYSADDVEAIVLNNSSTDDYAQEYKDLQAHRTFAKTTAKTVIESGVLPFRNFGYYGSYNYTPYVKTESDETSDEPVENIPNIEEVITDEATE